MADEKISTLNPALPLAGDEIVVIVQDGESVRTTLADIAAYIKTAETIIPTALPFRGARVKLSADKTPGGGFQVIVWDAEDRDTDSLWTLAAPDRFTVPPNVTKVKLRSYIRYPLGATGSYSFFQKNGGYFIGGGGAGSEGQAYDVMMQSSVVDVVAGDFFQVQVYNSGSLGSGSSGFVGLGCWFEIEIVEFA